MAQSNDWWANDPVAENGKALPDGSVVFNLPPSPADVAKEQREQRRLEIAEEEAARADIPSGYRVTADGNLEPIPGGPASIAGEASAKEQANKDAKITAATNLRRQLDQIKSIFNRSFSGPNPFEYLPSADKSRFQAIATAMRADLKPLIRGPNEGTFTEGDQALLDSLIPNPDNLDAYNEQTFEELDARINAAFQQFGGKASAAAPTAQPEQRRSALEPTGTAPQTEVSGSGETFLTPEDMQLQSRLSQAYQAGATLEELQAISAEFNRAFPIGSQQELDAARAQGRAVTVQPSGRRTEAMNAIGAVADTPVGAAFVGASNAILSGALDELAPIIGGDAATVQAAKEFLRDKYPVSSVAGEIGGSALQLAAGGAALRGAGLGARGLMAGEIAQGAAYGAGESNENRLAGAALGAGGAVVGQQIAGQLTRRLGAPEAQAVVGRVAQETGAPPQAVEQALTEALDSAAGAQLAQPVAEEAATEFGTLAQKAVGRGRAAQKAKEQLAVVASINPEAKAAAERLGVELPLDVLSDDVRLLTTTGLARSQIGSDAQATWGQAVSGAIQRSDETLAEIGATRDLAQVSDDVRARLERDIGDLETQAATLRREVDDAVNVQDRVEATNLQAALGETINDLGGIAEAKQAFTAEEKKLLAMLGEGEAAKKPTYARLNQVRDQIGRALNKGQGPWVDAPTALLKKYYGALAKDQLAYIESVGGQELADKMRGSNDLFSQMFKSRETMQSVFGQKLERDIGGLINRTITGAAKGDAQNLRTLMKAVPDDMKPRVLLSGLMAQAERGSAQGGFSFNNYAKMYRGLRQNSPIYAEIAKTIGPERAQILQDLYVISNRMAAAESKIVRTGASNQPILNALKAESLLGNIARGTAQAGSRVAGGMAGGAAAGPLGAVAGQEAAGKLVDTLMGAGKGNLEKMHALISSEGFRDLTEKVASGEIADKAVNRVANDGPFRKFAATVLGIKDPAGRKNWLMQALQASPAVGAVQATTEEQPNSMIEVR